MCSGKLDKVLYWRLPTFFYYQKYNHWQCFAQSFIIYCTEKLHFIGHSQGSAVMFALLSQTERYNQVVQSFTAISPITRIGSARTSFRPLIAALSPLLRYVCCLPPSYHNRFILLLLLLILLLIIQLWITFSPPLDNIKYIHYNHLLELLYLFLDSTSLFMELARCFHHHRQR